MSREKSGGSLPRAYSDGQDALRGGAIGGGDGAGHGQVGADCSGGGGDRLGDGCRCRAHRQVEAEGWHRRGKGGAVRGVIHHHRVGSHHGRWDGRRRDSGRECGSGSSAGADDRRVGISIELQHHTIMLQDHRQLWPFLMAQVAINGKCSSKDSLNADMPLENCETSVQTIIS